MKIEVTRQDVAASGMIAQREFTVKVGAHLMKILSGIYTNPVDAMVREYLTNMYDAYLALRAKNPTAEIIPPILSAPSLLDGTLVFKDFGIGMSPETVWEVYCQYGNSTKNDSDVMVGGFGLGSKTAFCYGNGANWMIESRVAGMRHDYIAYINEENVPSLTHVSSAPTEEHSGVTIRIPIRRGDIEEARDAVVKYAQHFPMPLTVENIEITPTVPVLSGEGWYVLHPRHSTVEFKIVMGNVPYSVPHRELEDNILPSGQDYYVRSFLLDNAFVVTVPIGSMDIVPSRDALMFTDKTRAALAARIPILLDNVRDAVNLRLGAAKTEWEALALAQSFHSLNQFDDVFTEVTYRGEKIDVARGVQRTLKQLQTADPTLSGTVLEIESSRNATPKLLPLTGASDREHAGVVRLALEVTDIYNKPVLNTFIVINDAGDSGLKCARNLLTEKLVCFRTGTHHRARWGHTPGVVALLNTTLTKQEVATLFGGAPEDQIYLASEWTVTKYGKSYVPIKDTVYKYSTNNRWEARAKMPDASTTRYYVLLTQDERGGRYTYRNDKFLPSRLIMMAHTLKLMNPVDVLYGVKDDAGLDKTIWKNLETVVIAGMTQWVTANKKLVAAGRNLITGSARTLYFCIKNCPSKLCRDFTTLFDMTAGLSENDTYNAICAFLDRLGFESLTTVVAGIKKNEKGRTLSALETLIMGKYPMLPLVVNSYIMKHYGLCEHYEKILLDYMSQCS